MSPTAARLLRGVAKVESSGQGDYTAVGNKTSSGDRAYGKYQVMGANVGNWTEAYLGVRMSIEDFLNDPLAQDKLAGAIFTERIGRYGNLHDPVSEWFSGQRAYRNEACDVNGMCVPTYIQHVLLAMARG